MSAKLARYHFTADEYQRMGEVGIFHEDDRVELIRGEIVEMSPIGSNHASHVIRCIHLFTSRLAGRALVSPQSPVRVAYDSEPQPDIVLLRPRDDFYETALPTPEDVLLVVEIAESSLRYDRSVKLPLYAERGILELWIVDLRTRTLEVYTNPTAKGYASCRRLKRGDTIVASAFPDVTFAVSEILG